MFIGELVHNNRSAHCNWLVSFSYVMHHWLYRWNISIMWYDVGRYIVIFSVFIICILLSSNSTILTYLCVASFCPWSLQS